MNQDTESHPTAADRAGDSFSEISPQFLTVFLLLLVGHLVIMNITSILPFQDTGFHLAVAEVNRNFDEPGLPYSNFFALNRGIKPNSMHVIWTSLAPLDSVIQANKLFYAAYIISLPTLTLFILVLSGGSPWASLLVFPFLYNHSVSKGFVEFTGAIPLILLVVLLLVFWHRNESLKIKVVTSVALATTFFAHALGIIFSILVVATFILANYWKDRSRMMRSILVLIPGIALLITWYLPRLNSDGNGLAWLFTYYRIRWFESFDGRVSDILFLDNYPIGKWWAAFIVVVTALVTMAHLGAYLWRRYRRNETCSTASLGKHILPIVVLSVVSAIVTLIGPPDYPPFSHVFQRFSLFAMISCVLLVGLIAPRLGTQRFVSYLAVALATLHLGLWAEYFWEFRREQNDFLRVTETADHSCVLGVYLADNTFRTEWAGLEHMANYFTPLRGGIVSSELYDFPYTTVERKVSTRFLPKMSEVAQQGPEIYSRTDSVIEILTRGEFLESDAFASDFESVASSGEWQLYRRREPGRSCSLPTR